MSTRPPAFTAKYAAEVERRSIDWTTALAPGDAIAASEWASAPAGLTLTGEIVEGKKTFVTVAGGVAGERYALTNTITTTAGWTLVEAPILRVVAPGQPTAAPWVP